MDKYLKKCPFEIERKNEARLIVGVKFKSSQYKEFLDSVMGVKITTFAEKPFTLQDYFMSFYKEERDFGGLEGVKGNTKEGLKKIGE